MIQETQKAFNSALRAAGYKATPGRLALLELLRKSKKPLGIPEISKGLRGKKMDQVTLYRALATLEKIGLVRKVDLRHGHADYEFAHQDDHHHLNCLKCGKIQDFSGCDLGAVIRKALKKNPGFAEVSQHSLELFGLCKKCAAKGT